MTGITINNQLGADKREIRKLGACSSVLKPICLESTEVKSMKNKREKVIIYFKFSHGGPGSANEGRLRPHLAAFVLLQ